MKFCTYLLLPFIIISCSQKDKELFYVEYLPEKNTFRLPYYDQFHNPQAKELALLTQKEIYQTFAIDIEVNTMTFPEVHFDIYILKQKYRNKDGVDKLEIILRTVNDKNNILDSFTLARLGDGDYCDGRLNDQLEITQTCDGMVNYYSINKKTGKFVKTDNE